MRQVLRLSRKAETRHPRARMPLPPRRTSRVPSFHVAVHTRSPSCSTELADNVEDADEWKKGKCRLSGSQDYSRALPGLTSGAFVASSNSGWCCPWEKGVRSKLS